MTDRRFEFLCLFALALLWGSSYLFIRVAVAEIPPLTLIAARVAIASLFLLAVLGVSGVRLPKGREVWGALLVQALLGNVAAWTILAWGQQHIDSGLASVLNSTSPIFVFFISLCLGGGEALGARRLLGAGLGVAGVALIVGLEALDGLGRALAGQGAALFGAFLYGCAALYGRRFSHLPAMATAAGTMIWSSAVLIPASLLIDRPWRLSPSPDALGAALALGVFCTGAALLLYFRLIRTLGAMGVASQAYLRAGVGVLLGAALLGEQVAPTTGAGLLAVLLGVWLINAPPRRVRAHGSA